MRAFTALLLGLLSTGCATSVKLLPQSLDCPVPTERAAVACADPQTLPEGASFEQLVRASIQDRQALQVCEKRRADLAQTLSLCHRAVAEHLGRLHQLQQSAPPSR